MASTAWVWVTPGRGNGPLGPALELDPQVQAAPQDDGDDPERNDERREPEPDPALADEVEPCLSPVEAGDRAVTPPGLGEEGPGGIIEADQLLFVEVVGVDVLFEELDVLLAHVVERTAVFAVLGAFVAVRALAVRSAAATATRAHEPPPAAAPTG